MTEATLGRRGLGVAASRQGEGTVPIEFGKLEAVISGVANHHSGAMQADGGGVFDCKQDGLGGGAKGARALRQCSVPVAAKIELGASVEVRKCHIISSDPA